MHYSIIPAEMIFDDWDGKELDRYQEIKIHQRQCVVEPLENNQVRIVQLLSSNPHDFLDARYQPGSIIEMSAQFVDNK